MKRQLTLAITMIMFVALLATGARSQTASSQLLRAPIPFAFHVGSRELPAGEYYVTVLNPSSDQQVLRIRSADGRYTAMVATLRTTAKSAAQSKLAFHRYADTYFFAQAHVAGEPTALAALKSNAERMEERTIASKGGKTIVTIVAE